jgi:ecdysteroid 25-hydroxylase CYP302A1
LNSIISGVNIVWLFDPEDIKTMFANEGPNPARRSHLALEKYRLDRPHLYNNGGLLPTNGLEWFRLRQESQKLLALQSSLGKSIDISVNRT